MELGKEQCFLDLITGVIDPELRRRLVRHVPKYALDMGSGIGTTLVLLHYALGIDHLEGIDSESASTVLKWHNSLTRSAEQNELTSIEEAWLEVTTDELDARPRITDAARMRELLNISYDSPIGVHDFKWKSYDLIILSNVLHYLYAHVLEYTFEMVSRLSHDRTLIYIRITDGFEGSKLSSTELLRYCRAFADARGLIEYVGELTEQGTSYTFTNI